MAYSLPVNKGAFYIVHTFAESRSFRRENGVNPLLPRNCER
jgi:hypothetical protein